MNAADRMREKLAALSPMLVEIVDDSAKHAGHAGAKQGGHYQLKIVAAAFSGQTKVARQRIVHQTLGDLAPLGIHALSIQALTPEEL